MHRPSDQIASASPGLQPLGRASSWRGYGVEVNPGIGVGPVRFRLFVLSQQRAGDVGISAYLLHQLRHRVEGQLVSDSADKGQTTLFPVEVSRKVEEVGLDQLVPILGVEGGRSEE